MRAISRTEAARCSLSELHGLYRKAFNALAAADRGTDEYRNALSALQTIEAELACRPG